MNYISLVVLIFIISFLFIGAEIYELDIQTNNTRDIYNYTNYISIPKINISHEHPIEKTKGVINEGRLYLIIDSFVNFLLVSTEQVVKMGIEYGYQHPNINWTFIYKILIWILVVSLIVMLIKPIGYILIFIIMIFIMLKDRKKKKKKKQGVD